MMPTLEELRAEGRLVSTGTFDLDPARAREKLARYQLTDPHRYVLQFVQAAQLLGASRIDAKIDADEVEMRFDGESPTAAELGEIYLHAFGQRGVRKLEALRHLALGVIAAEAVEPAVIRVAGTGGTLTVRDAQEQVAPEDVLPHNEVYVRERTRLGHVVEFFRTIRGLTAEEVALRDARYAKPKLVVNGQELNDARRRPQGSVPITSMQESGWVAARTRTGEDAVTLVQHGVALEELLLSIGNMAITGVVETSRLTTNLSQSAFVRNHMWDALMETVVMPAALAATDAFLSRQLRMANRPNVEAMIAAALRCRTQLRRRAEPVDAVDTIVMRWADIPIWRRLETRASGSPQISTQELFNAVGEGPIFVSTVDEELDVMRHRGTVVEHVLLVPRDRDASSPLLLGEATDRAVIDLTEDVREVARIRSARTNYGDRDGLRQRGDRLSLDPSRWAHVERASGEKLRVELAVPDVQIRQSLGVIVLVNGIVRLRAELSCGPLAGCGLLVALDEATDEPPTELLRAAAPLLVEAATGLLDVDDGVVLPRTLLVELLYAHTVGKLAGPIYEALGWGEDAVDAPSPQALLGGLTSSSAAARLFERVDSRQRVSMRALAESVPIRYIDAGSRRRALQIAWEIEVVGGDAVLWLDERERAILAWAFGEDALVDVEAELHAAAARIQRGRTGFVEEPLLHGLYVRKRSLEGAGLRGEVGMTDPGGTSSFIELVVLHEGKRLAHRELPIGVGQFRAIVEDESLSPTADVSDVVEDEAFEALSRRVRAVCEELFEAWCARLVESEVLDEVDRLTLWRAITHATEDQWPHRLAWKVFATTDGVCSVVELRERVGTGSLTVAPTAADGQFTVFVPLASVEHLTLLARLLPNAQIARSRQSIAAGSTSPSPAIEAPREVREDSVVGVLSSAGFPVDTLDILADSAIAPTLRHGRLTIGANHLLQQHNPSLLVVCVIALFVARDSSQLAAALRLRR